MAAALVTDERDALNCTICNEEFKRPKLLSCQHSFCTQCLVQRHREVDEDKEFCCPTCQRKIELEDDAIDSIPDNYLYRIIKEAHRGICTSDVKCISCAQDDETTKATHKCLDCGDTLCQNCNKWHCKFTATKHHVVVAIADLREGKFQEEFSSRKVLYCDLHSTGDLKVPLSSYCDDCKSLVCVACMQGDHRQHGVSKIHTVRERQHRKTHDEFSNLENSQRDQGKRSKNIEKVITDTKQKWSHQETDIYDTATELYAIIDTIKDEKLAELKSHYEKELKYLNELLEQERNRLSSLQATVAFTKIFLEKCSDSDFLYREHDIKNRIGSSQMGFSNSYKRELATVEKEKSESTLQVVGDVFGRIKKHEKQFLHKCRIGIVQEKFRKKINMKTICGLAYDTTLEEILVAGWSDDEAIKVLDEDGCFRRIIRSNELNVSFDIDSRESEIVLSIYLEDFRRVVMINQNGTIKKSVMIPEDDQESNEHLGIVVDDHTIFIASSKVNRVYKIFKDEDKLSTFISKRNLNSPSYLCIAPTGELLVSNSGSSNIQVYSKEGEIQWQYDGKEEGETLRNPKGICCDEDGYIYVLDLGNCRIQVIHDKKLVGIIPIDKEAEEELCVPLTLTPDEGLVYGYKDNIVRISFWQ